MSDEPYLIAARALVFTRNERDAGRTHSIAQAVRHIERHGYPPKITASFAEFERSGSKLVGVLAADLQHRTPGLTYVDAFSQVTTALADVAGRSSGTAAAAVSFAAPPQNRLNGLLSLCAAELSHYYPRAGTYLDALSLIAASIQSSLGAGNAASFAEPPRPLPGNRSSLAAVGEPMRAASAAAAALERRHPNISSDRARDLVWRAVNEFLSGRGTPPPAPSFAEPQHSETDLHLHALHQVAVELRRLVPNLSYQEAMRRASS
ncbi:MAG TPA: hypothetical protein VH331_14400 [Allosphingosinicella sp.]|jgi:hypothetical protein|nr:hypothetical protein [Allosphingosinicella sp.]